MISLKEKRDGDDDLDLQIVPAPDSRLYFTVRAIRAIFLSHAKAKRSTWLIQSSTNVGVFISLMLFFPSPAYCRRVNCPSCAPSDGHSLFLLERLVLLVYFLFVSFSCAARCFVVVCGTSHPSCSVWQPMWVSAFCRDRSWTQMQDTEEPRV